MRAAAFPPIVRRRWRPSVGNIMPRANGDGSTIDDFGEAGEARAKPPAAPTERPAADAPGRDSAVDPARAAAYWRANMLLMAALLAVWAVVSFGFGIWLREPLDALSIAGAPLGFWFAQQGSIYVFVALIFVYVWRMKRLDDRYGVDGSSEAGRGGE